MSIRIAHLLGKVQTEENCKKHEILLSSQDSEGGMNKQNSLSPTENWNVDVKTEHKS